MSSLSVYIHWPFCLSLCPYCDFNSHVANQIDYDIWCDAYIKEISYFEKTIKNRYIQSIFFGGGTPSLMEPKLVEYIINKLGQLGIVDDDTEITLEANPTSYEAKKFKDFKNAGINRVSIGIQSLNDTDLKLLGRKHSVSEALKALDSASELFNNFSFDLIYARPNQSLQDWHDELKRALTITRDHISLYQLTIEKGTPFFAQYKSGQLAMPPTDLSADMYNMTNSILEEHGFNRYEISNYAKPGKECKHNLAYWHYDEYIGIGPGAHGRIHENGNIFASMMIHPPTKWLQAVKENGCGIQKNIELSKQEVIEEILMMGLRLKEGLNEQTLIKITGHNFQQVLDQKFLNSCIQNNLIMLNNGILQLTNNGLLLHNYIVSRLL